MPDALACLAASAALAVSDVPIKEIISEVRIGRVEGQAQECNEEDLVKAMEMAHDAIRIQIQAQEELRAKVGVTGKRDYTKPRQNPELQQKVADFAKDKIYQIAKSASAKHDRSDAIDTLKKGLIESLGEEVEDADKKLAKKYFDDLQ